MKWVIANYKYIESSMIVNGYYKTYVGGQGWHNLDKYIPASA